MAQTMNANKAINGTFGFLWLDGEKFANVKSFEAKITINYTDVILAGDLATHKKMTGWSGAGTMTLHKVDSKMALKVANDVQTGNLEGMNVVAKLEDPAAFGAERVSLTGVLFDEATLLAFTQGELGEESVPFTFDGYEFLDVIE